VPILDHHFVEWSARVDPALKLRRREGKYVFKKSLEPLVAAETLYREKMGFAVPLAGWFRGPLRERVRQAVTGPTLAETGIFDVAYLRTLVDQHESGAYEHSAVLWSLLMFESFLRQVHEIAPAGSAPSPALVPAGGR
jgi:asparagine synthase (glutamine-hydrolysing)